MNGLHAGGCIPVQNRHSQGHPIRSRRPVRLARLQYPYRSRPLELMPAETIPDPLEFDDTATAAIEKTDTLRGKKKGSS